MIDTARLLMRDAGLGNANDTDAKMEQFVNDAFTMEKQVAYVSQLQKRTKKGILKFLAEMAGVCDFFRFLQALMKTDRRWRWFGQFTTIGEIQRNFSEVFSAQGDRKLLKSSLVKKPLFLFVGSSNLVQF